jgi:hypothetical protein
MIGFRPIISALSSLTLSLSQYYSISLFFPCC